MSGLTRKLFLLIGLSVLAVFGPQSVLAQIEFSGTWNLDTTTYLPDYNTPCAYTGTATITLVGINLNGMASLKLASGPGACPSEMSAEVSGEVTLQGIKLGMLLGGQLGEITFSGLRPKAMKTTSGTGGDNNIERIAQLLAGTFEVTKGPFVGQTGSWNAVKAAAPMSESPIPGLAMYGILALVLILALAGGFSLRRKRLPG